MSVGLLASSVEDRLFPDISHDMSNIGLYLCIYILKEIVINSASKQTMENDYTHSPSFHVIAMWLQAHTQHITSF